MTRPPCKVDGVDCPRRCVGCQSSCKAYHDWLVIHAAEKDAMRRDKDRTCDADGFLAGQTKRKNIARQREREREKWR